MYDIRKTLVSALLATAFMVPAAGAHAQQRVAIGTASTGSHPYVLGSVVAKEVSNNSGLDVGVQTTGGFNENLGLVSAGQVDVGINFLPDLIDAYHQQGRFEQAKGTDMFKNLRLLFPVYLGTYHYIVREDSGITTFEELEGRRFNVNVPSTATYAVNMALITMLGKTPEDFDIANLTGKDTYDALRNRLIDASGTGLEIGGGALVELSSSVPIRLLEVPDAAYDALDTAYHKTLVRTVIPGGTYAGQDEDNKTFSIVGALFASDKMDDETAYAFTKAYWEQWEHFEGDAKRMLGDVDVQLASVPREIPFQAGAERYFRERGLIK